MPEPRPNESKKAYITRCVSVVMGEGKTQDQALGKCYGMWKQHVKDKRGNYVKNNLQRGK